MLGGIPLDELGATGFGLAVCAGVLSEAKVAELTGARVVIQGFGAVGSHAARALAERGATVIAVSDIGHTDSGSEAGATATYVRASLAEVAAALAALAGEPHPLATTEGW